ncbi:MAG: hybrid sensor histidine kinase/response regulator, partial [Lachnospiraceae bacterium]|nr:hybrid sensor histidine kinase/response regulator [Lachnospiraceae bacterium]
MHFDRFAKIIMSLLLAMSLVFCVPDPAFTILAADEGDASSAGIPSESDIIPGSGGGYAVTGQLGNAGYSAQKYDSSNGLPTSDANYILSADDGYIWIGGYAGIIRYDGRHFERLDSSDGLTNGRVIFQDRKKRIWVGTNDNGVVMINGNERTHYTYRDGLRSSSIRGIAEGADGIIYIGTTNGIDYIKADGSVHNIDDGRLNGESVMRLVADRDGVVYGNNRGGYVFSLENGGITRCFDKNSFPFGNVSCIYAEPDESGKLYLAAEDGFIYYGALGANISELRKISVAPLNGVWWIQKACNRLWVNSDEKAGYVDEKGVFHLLNNIPLNNSIEMMTPDYQGNLWYASSRQGIMKIVTSNFQNINEIAEIPGEVTNATAFRDETLYIGTDEGLQIVSSDHRSISNPLSVYIGSSRVRCITQDSEGNLWFCVYNNDKGLICYTKKNEIIDFTENEGMPTNQIRCATVARDGSILVGTNAGLAVIRDMKVVKCYGAEDGLQNTSVLTVEEGKNGIIYVGSDGDGIYAISRNRIDRLGRDEGLTSDVVMRIKWDEEREVFWVVTSNSIEYMVDNRIYNIENFPYNNNFDVYYNSRGDIWILSSFGLFCAKASDLLSGNPFEYKLYNTANGLPSIPTSNSFSALTEDGNLFIAGRTGISMVNIDHYYEGAEQIKTDLESVNCSVGEVLPGDDGVFSIPSEATRIQLNAAILDFGLTNPLIRLFLEGTGDTGMTEHQSDLTSLEFTGLKYGTYKFHVQVLNESTQEVLQDDIYIVEKKPRLTELLAFKVLLVVLIAGTVGLIVWKVMTGTVIRRQYIEIQKARDEAERANSAKSRFLANMSHEIRTPINTIMGMDEMIIREDSRNVPKQYSAAVTGYAMDIKNASEALLGLVNDLLDISRIESGKMHLVEQEYDTGDMLRSLITMIRVRSDAKKLYFDVEVDHSLPVRLYGDVSKIKQIVLNLLTNAVKYTDEGGFVLKVEVLEKNDLGCSLRISVKDTGIGVKPEDLDRLFTAYERLDEVKNSGIQGTGLGLDISRQFAELMEGNLSCVSTYGMGSEFIFTFKQKIVDPAETGVFNEEDNRI